MINKLDIPISYNEARALISLVNKRKSGTLNVNEFINLVYDQNSNIDLNTENLDCKNQN